MENVPLPVGRKTEGNTLLEKFWSCRWFLAALLILLGTALKLNGSSFGMWSYYVPSDSEIPTLFGSPRPINSDEWAVLSPMILSQSKGTEPYSAASQIIRGTETDTSIVYGLPIRNFFSILFRPFLTGFLFMDFDHGMAFYWCTRLVMLAMVFLELLMVVTKGDKALSLTGSLLASLSPAVQWCFARNGLLELMICGGGAVLLLRRFITDDSRSRRLLCLCGIYACACGYTAVLYPAYMVPLAYVFAALAGWIVITEKGCIDRRNLLGLVSVLGVFALTLLYVWGKHADTIRAVLNTAYPGRRVFAGGDGGFYLFAQWGNLFLPFTEEKLVTNAFEVSVFPGFFPLGAIFCTAGMIRSRKADLLSVLLMCVCALLMVYGVFGLPRSLAMFTLLSHTNLNRWHIAFGVSNFLLLIRSLSLWPEKCRFGNAAMFAALYACTAAVTETIAYEGYIGWKKGGVIAVLAFLLAFCLFRFGRRREHGCALLLLAGIAVLNGAKANPLQRGCLSALDSDLGKEITEVVERDPEGLWVTEGLGLPINNYPILFGAPTINSTNVYPALDRWEALDPAGQDVDVYNRYAHITVKLTDQPEQRFRLTSADTFEVYVTPEELAEILNVSYVLSARELEPLDTDRVSFLPISAANRYRIYQVCCTGGAAASEG